MALLTMEITRNRSVIVHSLFPEKYIRVMTTLFTLMHPLEVLKFYSISSFPFSSADNISAWIKEAEPTPFVIGCCTKDAAGVQEISQLSTNHQFSYFDLDCDMVMFPGEAYVSVSCHEALQISPKGEIRRLVQGYQKISVPSLDDTDTSITNVETKNFHLASLFKSFMNGIWLKNIPASLTLYPDKQVVSCDIATLMHHTLHEATAMPSNAADEFAIISERKKFIENVVDSCMFLEFIARHGFALSFLQ
eukprot:CAMPEP_0114450538 /NCGR_PEP_ID=MMETSP0104-20121206/513_1 /TAXON_ID=37642 ORGANISM="Paraphysomonas imperforata, Strain PA2" /NCGR_SAMPLE_ID=MMETSP0104 /ASSEMBLY_ACC=CAM_ASM_000202 /LENGTH=248 /DNA_ID=CAMNT_0001622685 /DNA_START=158 /DNA_END=904 /DNA_ORIENTATION=+